MARYRVVYTATPLTGISPESKGWIEAEYPDLATAARDIAEIVTNSTASLIRGPLQIEVARIGEMGITSSNAEAADASRERG
jgi:hypothetical protein